MNERKLNEQESLDLIAQMIRNSKQNLEKGNGNVFIIWGVTTLCVSAIVGLALYFTQNMACTWLWMLIPAIGWGWSYFATSKNRRVCTQIDKLITKVWAIIGIVCVLLPIAFVLLLISKEQLIFAPSHVIFAFMPFIQMLIVSIGLAITGAVIDFKPSLIGGLVGVVISMFTLIQFPYGSIVWFMVWSVASMIIPGIKLNLYIKKQKQNV